MSEYIVISDTSIFKYFFNYEHQYYRQVKFSVNLFLMNFFLYSYDKVVVFYAEHNASLDT